MPRKLSVGRSLRTPAKHRLMCAIYGREVGVLNKSIKHRDVARLIWLDLTAGDGVVNNDLPWHLNCSPGINAYYATTSAKPVEVTLYEIKPATFDRLVDNLSIHLSELGYDQILDTTWVYHDRVLLRAELASGAEATVGYISPSDAVLVSNDPNAITDWAMRATFTTELVQRGPWCFRSISTMGCNASGLMRLSRDVRSKWYDHIYSQVHALPKYRDLLLAAINGDSSKWAYLLCEPARWRESVESDVRSAFGTYGYQINSAWYRRDPRDFVDLTDKLFLTRGERENGER